MGTFSSGVTINGKYISLGDTFAEVVETLNIENMDVQHTPEGKWVHLLGAIVCNLFGYCGLLFDENDKLIDIEHWVSRRQVAGLHDVKKLTAEALNRRAKSLWYIIVEVVRAVYGRESSLKDGMATFSYLTHTVTVTQNGPEVFFSVKAA